MSRLTWIILIAVTGVIACAVGNGISAPTVSDEDKRSASLSMQGPPPGAQPDAGEEAKKPCCAACTARTKAQEAFEKTKPKLGQAPPDFTLRTTKGESITLSSLLGEQPVVLEFANMTCGNARSNAKSMEQLKEKWQDRATFIIIYNRESSPGRGAFHAIKKPRSQDERDELAKSFAAQFRPGTAVLIDTIDDAIWTRYGSPHTCTFIIQGDGTVAYKELFAKPTAIEQELERLLTAEAVSE
jgi:peroxiredoxin